MTYISVERSLVQGKGNIIDTSTSSMKYRSGISGDYEIVIINKDMTDVKDSRSIVVTATPSFQSES